MGPALATVRALSLARDPARDSCVTTYMDHAQWRAASLAVMLANGLFASAAALAGLDSDRVALEATIQLWVKAVNAQDATALTNTMTEDVELLDASAATVKGRTAVVRTLRAAATRGRLVATSREITIANDVAWHVVGLAQVQKNGDVHARGQALEIWKRVQGKWKLHRRMAAGNLPPSGPLTRPSTSEPMLDGPGK